ncbi:hypothetical protein P4B35_22020 [Pontiellaceae bacterium B12227]|nr:hypothetical protein [Pontiellaceae bacterium B12227]
MPTTRKPVQRKPGRPRKDEIQERLAIYTQHDEQILKEHDTWLELDISTPSLPHQILKIDKPDYEALKTDLAGRFIARISAAFNNQPLAYVHTRNKDGKFGATPSYVHNLICKHRGFLWHRNGDQLDNRRANLETNIPMQTSTVGADTLDTKTPPYSPEDMAELYEFFDNKPAIPPKPPTVFPPKPIPPKPHYDPSDKHEIINLITGKPETIEADHEENQKG